MKSFETFTTGFVEETFVDTTVAFSTTDFAEEVFAKNFVLLFTTDFPEDIGLFQLYRTSLHNDSYRRQTSPKKALRLTSFCLATEFTEEVFTKNFGTFSRTYFAK